MACKPTLLPPFPDSCVVDQVNCCEDYTAQICNSLQKGILVA